MRCLTNATTPDTTNATAAPAVQGVKMRRFRAFANPRNLFHRRTSHKWMCEDQGNTTTVFDDGQVVLKYSFFDVNVERPELCELHTAAGDVYRRASLKEPWQCIAGTRLGERFDDICLWIEEVTDEKLGPLLGTADINLVGSDAVICEFPE